MDYSCEEVQAQLEELKAFSFRLGEAMGRTAEDLRATGLSPSPELIADLQNYRQQFQGVRTWLENQRGSSTTDTNQQPLGSLEDLQRDFENKLAVRRTVEFLDHFQNLAHVEGHQHPVLGTCQHARQAALDAIQGPEATSRTIIRAITDGQHPLNALSNLLQTPDSLSDDAWTEALDRVTKHLGQDVATAVARHKLYLSPRAEMAAKAEMGSY